MPDLLTICYWLFWFAVNFTVAYAIVQIARLIVNVIILCRLKKGR